MSSLVIKAKDSRTNPVLPLVVILDVEEDVVVVVHGKQVSDRSTATESLFLSPFSTSSLG